MRRRPPRSTRTDTLVPSTTRFRAAQPGESRAVRRSGQRRNRITKAQLAQKLPAFLPVGHHSPGGAAEKRQRDGAIFAIDHGGFVQTRSEEHTSELQSLMRISYAVICLKKKQNDAQKRGTGIR